MRFLLVFLCIFGTALGQERISRQLQPFQEVKVYDGLSVELVPSDRNEAIITGANTSKVAFVEQDGVLKIRMEIDKLFSGYRTFVRVHYTDGITIIDVNEDALITTADKIRQPVLDLRAQEGGELQIDAEVEQLLVKSVTGGRVVARGSCFTQDVSINTGGVYKGMDFKTKFSTVTVNAGSLAEIFATDYVKATVKAGGEVRVFGDPKKMEEKTVFGGKIRRM